MSHHPRAMVILASEQLWPNIQGLVHWHRHKGGIKDLFIYYTDDSKRSAEPAKRFATFARKLYPNLNVHLLEQSGGRLPSNVYQQIVAWQRQLPDRYWIINATGGLKLMFAGALRALDLPETEIVYRELSGEWYRWRKIGNSEELQPVDVDLSETNDIPVRYLVQAQSAVAAECEWSCEKAQHLPVLDLVQHGLKAQWNWREVFRRCGLPSQEQAGFLFEKFVAATLLEFGIKQACLNVTLKNEATSVQEIDIIANHRGRIFIIDCKLRTEEEEGKQVENLTSQIRQAAATCREFGGAGAKLLMVRPGRRFRKSERQLATDLGLAVLDSTQTMGYFRELARFLGWTGDLPPQLAAAQRLLDQEKDKGCLEAFAKTNLLNRNASSREPLSTVLRLESYLEGYMTSLGQDWVVYRLGNQTYLYFTNANHYTRGEILEILRNRLSPVAQPKSVNISKLGNVGRAELTLNGPLEELKQFLVPFVGQNMLSKRSHG